MGSKTIGIGCFFAGVMVGVTGTYLYLQKWVNDRIHEEIQEYREKYSEEKKAALKENRSKDEEVRAEDFDDDSDDEYVRTKRLKSDVEELTNLYSNRTREKGGNGSFIEVVPPLEFEHFEENPKYEDYKRVYLTYYYPSEEGGQGVLAESETKDLVLDLRSTVGVHFDDHFEDYEDEDAEADGIEACYIRNDKLKVFYEITKDLRTYKEAVGKDI